MNKILINFTIFFFIQGCYAKEVSICKGKEIVSKIKENITVTCLQRNTEGGLVQTGPFIVKNKEGDVFVRGQSINGVPVGTWYNFDENGDLLKKCNYSQNKKGIQVDCFRKNGQKIIDK